MRKILLIFSLIIISGTAKAQFRLTGKIRTLKPIIVSLTDLNGEIIYYDTIISGREFSTGDKEIREDLYKLKLGELEKYIIFENTPVNIKGFLDDTRPGNTNLEFSGTTLNNNFINATDEFKKSAGGQNWNAIEDRYNPLILSSIVYTNKDYFFTKEEIINNLVNKLNESDKQSVVICELLKLKSVIDHYSVGSALVDFNLPDINGNYFSTANFKGKYILLDFWASWCGPCRAEMKSLHKIYEELKGDDLIFISVSLDDSRSDWIKALETDNIPWLALWDESGFNKSKFKEQFGFSTIPFIALIDKNGKLAARNLRGENVKNEILKLRNRK